jgi:hypothetical protein|tara:strand:- start:16306 stop:16506 length:201 start_codon:yes stop_codon:yes gene_type:complete
VPITKDFVSIVRRRLMTKGIITVDNIQDNEDGSAKVTLDMDAETYHKIFEYGFIQLVKKGIKVDGK